MMNKIIVIVIHHIKGSLSPDFSNEIAEGIMKMFTEMGYKTKKS
jgi:hypothetical protein